MATVRIYKVAELLGTTSQEVTALLKREHGIEVKSASSTIEEVVARQFVDVFESNVDFRRGIKRGDRFSIVYESLEADGEPLRTGRILSAASSRS